MQDLYGRSIGSTIKAVELFKALEKRNYKIDIYWRGENSAGVSKSDIKNVRSTVLNRVLRILFFTPRQMVQNILDFIVERKILTKVGPDLLIVRLDAFRVSGLFLAWWFKIPLIIEADGACSYEWVTFHNGPHLWTPVLYFCEKKMLRHSQGIFVQSQLTKDYYANKYGLNPDKIAVITNGAHTLTPKIQFENPVKKAELGISKSDVVIGFAGSIHYWHGMDEMQQFMRDTLEKFQSVKFLFVGSGGPLAKSFADSFQKDKNRIIFKGNVQHEMMPYYIKLFTIAIAPYPFMQLFYFSPVKLFEYMAAGKPIVAARIGQIADVLEHKKTGLLYGPGNFAEMQICIESLINDKKYRDSIGQNAQLEFKQKYTWHKKGQELDEFIRKTVK